MSELGKQHTEKEGTFFYTTLFAFHKKKKGGNTEVKKEKSEKFLLFPSLINYHCFPWQ